MSDGTCASGGTARSSDPRRFPRRSTLEKVQTDYENGGLSLTLPKSEAAKPRQRHAGMPLRIQA